MTSTDQSARPLPAAITVTAGWTTTPLSRTADPYIDGLLDINKWGGKAGTGVTLTYSFPWSTGRPVFDYSKEPGAAKSFGFSSSQQEATRLALQSWSNVANVKFIEVADTANDVGVLRFAFSSAVDPSHWGHAFFPDNYWPEGGDIWVHPQYDYNWKPASSDMLALTHEVGHALGLKHPFEEAAQLPAAYDQKNYTIMAYKEPANTFVRDGSGEWLYAINKPMVLDILAIQHIYGANLSYRTGNDTYSYDNRRGFFDAIWDAGGNDTLDLANFNYGNIIDLRDGAYSTVRLPGFDTKDNLGIAYGAIIENAVGGNGDDRITGNAADNVLRGNGGNDILSGGTGRNWLDGGAGLDFAVFSGPGDAYTQSRRDGAIVMTARDGSSVDSLVNIERLSFSNGVLAFDLEGTAGQAYRLYQAAFDRKPDTQGLAYWIRALDEGRTSLQRAAGEFVNSREFKSLYGDTGSVSNGKYVDLLYKNTLGRTYDAEGYKYWLGRLDSGQSGRDTLLTLFSDSPENKAKVAPDIADGIWYV